MACGGSPVFANARMLQPSFRSSSSAAYRLSMPWINACSLSRLPFRIHDCKCKGWGPDNRIPWYSGLNLMKGRTPSPRRTLAVRTLRPDRMPTLRFPPDQKTTTAIRRTSLHPERKARPKAIRGARESLQSRRIARASRGSKTNQE